ncbi:MAG: holo-ACP synthase [Dehalococcoidia bacterium]
MIGNGIDIIEIDRIQDACMKWGERFLNRIYTQQEQQYCRGRFPQLAARFAAKEAMMKSLGTGKRGLLWVEIEVVRERGRAPTIVLHGNALAIAESQNVKEIQLTISHSRGYAVASTLAIKY